jgi:hypothetical protein
LKRTLKYALVTAAFALSIPFTSLQAQSARTQQQTQTTTKEVSVSRRSTSASQDTCDCPPAYKELNFLRSSDESTFSSKEVWTLDKGDGTDLFALYCDSSSVKSLLELVEFKDKAMKKTILSREYTTIEDNLGREHIRIETGKGTRYFTVQARDEKDKGVIGIDGVIHPELLKNHGNRLLRMYVEVGESAGIDEKTGRVKVRSLDSGDLIIPYYDCEQPLAPPLPLTSTLVPAGITINNIVNAFDYSTRINISVENNTIMKEKSRREELLSSDILRVSVLGGIWSDATQKKPYECGEFDIHTKPLLLKLSTYARTLENLHLNAAFTHLHADASFSDTTGNALGEYGLTADDFLVDARFNALHSSTKLGLGVGGILEYNAATQRGNAQEYPLDGNSKRISGLLGIVLFAADAKLDAGLYAGYSSELGTLLNATARLNDTHIGKLLDIDAHLFFERYNGDHGKGNRAGLEAFVSGPAVLGFLKPTVGYEAVQTIYLGNTPHLETGVRRALFVGVTADLGALLRRSSK